MHGLDVILSRNAYRAGREAGAASHDKDTRNLPTTHEAVDIALATCDENLRLSQRLTGDQALGDQLDQAFIQGYLDQRTSDAENYGEPLWLRPEAE